jgi:hypothetical protein
MKYLLSILFALSPSLLLADAITVTSNPKMLLKSTNTWTAPQTFNSSTTFNGQITLNGGCIGCGGGTAGAAYPDWIVDGTFNGVNAKGANPLYFKSLEIEGDVYVLNSYTEHE